MLVLLYKYAPTTTAAISWPFCAGESERKKKQGRKELVGREWLNSDVTKREKEGKDKL